MKKPCSPDSGDTKSNDTVRSCSVASAATGVKICVLVSRWRTTSVPPLSFVNVLPTMSNCTCVAAMPTSTVNTKPVG